MCRGNADMRWQFGGNFQPVHMICEENWKECPIAVLNYIWSEIVTEVVDCLQNDVLIWRIIAMVVVFIMLIHTVYYKLRWIDETSVNRENFKRVGFKVQDLELKVNILTYKMQYGTWPLPHYTCKSNMGNELHNVRLTLSKSEERNTWIKHLLLSPRKNKDYNKNLTNSVNMSKLTDVETKYVSSKFTNDSPTESGDKTIKSGNNNLTRKWKRCKKCFDITLSKQKQISKSENLGLRHRHSLKSISLLKKERNDSQAINSSLDSNETPTLRKNSKITEKIERREQIHIQNQEQSQEQSQELSESYSESITTCLDRNIDEENQLERDSSDLSEESDINHNTKMGGEGRLEKAENPKMERITKRENNLEPYKVHISSTNAIQPSAKSTDDTFYSWTDYETVENTPRNEAPNFLPPSLNITFLTETFPKSSSFDKSTESTFGGSSHQHSLTSTQETLHQVREKLESLHNVLLAYESKDGNPNDESSIYKDCILYKDAKSKKSSKVSFNMDIKENVITQEETLNSSEYEQCESIIQSSSTSLSVQSFSNMFSIHREVVVHNPNYNRFDFSDSESEDEKLQSGLENNSNVSINTFTKIQFESKENLSEFKPDLAAKSYNVNFNIDRITTSHNQNYITDHKTIENYTPMDTSEDQISQTSSQIEFSDKFSNDENSDNESTSALLQEALQFKENLVTQLELEKELKINQKNTIKEKEDEADFRKNLWPKPDNYFQTKVLDIITEEQSASSSTEKTSKTFIMLKVSEEPNIPPHQRTEENSKSVLASTSSEYFSFSNLSQSDKVPRESDDRLDKENRNEFQSVVHSPNNKRVMKSEISPNDLVKRSRYMLQREEEEERSSEEKGSESERENLISNKQIKNFKEDKIRQEKLKVEKARQEKLKEEKIKQEKLKEKTKECSLKNCEDDFELQRMEEQNSNSLSPLMDSSSDESLTQFLRELASDKVKAARIFRESKLIFNSAKSDEKSSSANEAQEQESTVTLQRRPGSFSLTENKITEKSFKTLESTNSEAEVTTVETDADFERKEKNEESEMVKMIHKMDKNVKKRDNNCENMDTGCNFDLNDLEFSPRSEKRSIDASFTEENINEKKSEKSITKVSETKSKSEKYLESSERNKSEISLKEEIFESHDNQEKVDNSQSNLTSDPSSSLYCTAEAFNSETKLNSEYLTSSTSVSKANLEMQETILEDENEYLTSENKVWEDEYVKLNKEPKAEEAMLIDLSYNDSSEQKSDNKKPEISQEIHCENKHSKTENVNILDEVFTEKMKENVCLIPNKIQPMNESETAINNSSGTGSYVDAKGQEMLSSSGIRLSEKSQVNSPTSKMKISEMNKFAQCSSAPSLQRLPWNPRKNSFISSSSSIRSKQNVEIPVKSRTLLRSREKSVENSKDNCKDNYRNSCRETSKKEREPRARSYLNLNSDKQSSGDQGQRRSRSFVSPRRNQALPRSLNNFHCEEGIKSARDSVRNSMEMDQQVRFSSKTSIKSVESQKSSRSCIPILKTRLENIRKPEHRFRTRSPMRGPLTISPRSNERALKDAGDLNARKEVKGEKNHCNEKSIGDNTCTAINLLKGECPGPIEKTVIYVNIMTDQDQSKKKVVDPKKFLEYVKDRELKIQNIVNKKKNETDSEPKILTVISSVIENDELSKRNLQSKFSFQVEQKEREVSVKPSVIDNSTSISGFPEFCDGGKQDKSKFQIFQVPEELTKEEYIDLLDSLNQDPNLEQLKKMHKLCSKLGLGFQE